MSYHLRPVSEDSESSPSAPESPTGDQPLDKPAPVAAQCVSSPPLSTTTTRIRLPLSPTSLRDVNLTPDADPPNRNYPAPPTGHDLMALFPPAPPANFPENQPGHTSGYFAHQERAFFAQAGKEIVRARADFDSDAEMESGRSKHRGASRSWPPVTHTTPSHHAPPPAPPPPPLPQPPTSSAPPPYPHPISRPRANSGAPVTVYQVPPPHGLSPVPSNLHSPPHYPGPSGIRSSPTDLIHPGSAMDFSDDFRDDPDEAWRRPMPYAERRRAGKHTRRVIVRT